MKLLLLLNVEGVDDLTTLIDDLLMVILKETKANVHYERVGDVLLVFQRT